MQATTVQAPAPAPSAAVKIPEAARQVITITNVDGTTQTLPIPLSRKEVQDIRSRRSELSDQLTSAAGRRRRLADELLQQPPGPVRTGLEGRLAVLDNRLAQLELDIAATGRQLTAASQLGTNTEIPVNDIPDNALALSIVFTLFVLFPLAITLARNLWKRGNRVTVAPISAEAGQRLERLEQGVEAIAIEIERVSEGQRFVTKLLAEGAPAAKIPEKVAEEVRQ